MHIKEMLILNFRNYRRQELKFKPGIYVVQGDNGQGKSNFLEAIYHLCLTRSYKNYREDELVYWNAPYYFLQGTVFFQKGSYRIEVGFDCVRRRKVVKINGREGRLLDYLDICPVVFFVPEELELIRRGPDERRKFMDREISQNNSLYGDYLRRYNKALFQKNRLLKESSFSSGFQKALNPWNEQMIYFGSRIIKKRLEYVSSWDRLASGNYHRFFNGKDIFRIGYRTILNSGSDAPENSALDLKEIENRFRHNLEKIEREEVKKGFSLLGPHRDDLCFLLNGRDARRFASHGQQRSMIISLKAAQIHYFLEKEEKPLLLLDDIFSELDELRKQQCLKLFHKAEQVFITITGRERTENTFWKKFSPVYFLKVEDGKITEMES